jgi:hypothetical protein
MTQKTFKLSESFKKRADTACFFEAWVASILARNGLRTVHNPMVMDGKPGEADLLIYASWCGPVPVEVKSVNKTFNSAADYPADTIIVCSYNGWRRKNLDGRTYLSYDYLIVSRETGAIVWFGPHTPVNIGEAWDPERGEMYKVVTAQKDNLMDLIDFVECYTDLVEPYK